MMKPPKVPKQGSLLKNKFKSAMQARIDEDAVEIMRPGDRFEAGITEKTLNLDMPISQEAPGSEKWSDPPLEDGAEDGGQDMIGIDNQEPSIRPGKTMMSKWSEVDMIPAYKT